MPKRLLESVEQVLQRLEQDQSDTSSLIPFLFGAVRDPGAADAVRAWLEAQERPADACDNAGIDSIPGIAALRETLGRPGDPAQSPSTHRAGPLLPGFYVRVWTRQIHHLAPFVSDKSTVALGEEVADLWAMVDHQADKRTGSVMAAPTTSPTVAGKASLNSFAQARASLIKSTILGLADTQRAQLEARGSAESADPRNLLTKLAMEIGNYRDAVIAHDRRKLDPTKVPVTPQRKRHAEESLSLEPPSKRPAVRLDDVEKESGDGEEDAEPDQAKGSGTGLSE